MYYFILARRKTYKIKKIGHDKIIIIYDYWCAWQPARALPPPVFPLVPRGRVGSPFTSITLRRYLNFSGL